MNEPSIIENDYKINSKLDGGSRLVLGTSSLGGVWEEVDEQESIEAIQYALNEGVEVIDTAPSYNRAQEFVGKALRIWDGDCPFLSTKIGRLPAEKADKVYLDYSPEGMKKSIEESLDLLGVDFVDLLFLHEPQLVPIEKMDTILETLHSFQDEGIVGMLGIGGNPDSEFWPYVDNNHFDVVSTFLKMDACTLEGFNLDIPRYRNKELIIYAASSLHMGLLGSRFETYVQNPPDNNWIQRTHVENAIKVNEIAQQNGMSLTSLALRYLFTMQEADRVVLGPQNLDEVKDSLNIWKEGLLEDNIFKQVTNVLRSPLN